MLKPMIDNGLRGYCRIAPRHEDQQAGREVEDG